MSIMPKKSKIQVPADVTSSLAKSGDLALKTYLRVLGGMAGDVRGNIKRLTDMSYVNKLDRNTRTTRKAPRTTAAGFGEKVRPETNTNNSRSVGSTSTSDTALKSRADTDMTSRSRTDAGISSRYQADKVICQLDEVSSVCENFLESRASSQLDEADLRHYRHYHGGSLHQKANARHHHGYGGSLLEKTGARHFHGDSRQFNHPDHGDTLQNGESVKDYHRDLFQHQERLPANKNDIHTDRSCQNNERSTGGSHRGGPDTSIDSNNSLLSPHREQTFRKTFHNTDNYARSSQSIKVHNNHKGLKSSSTYTRDSPAFDRQSEDGQSFVSDEISSHRDLSPPVNPNNICHSHNSHRSQRSNEMDSNKGESGDEFVLSRKMESHLSSRSSDKKQVQFSNFQDGRVSIRFAPLIKLHPCKQKSKATTTVLSEMRRPVNYNFSTNSVDNFTESISSVSDQVDMKYDFPKNRAHSSTVYCRKLNAILFREPPVPYKRRSRSAPPPQRRVPRTSSYTKKDMSLRESSSKLNKTELQRSSSMDSLTSLPGNSGSTGSSKETKATDASMLDRNGNLSNNFFQDKASSRLVGRSLAERRDMYGAICGCNNTRFPRYRHRRRSRQDE